MKNLIALSLLVSTSAFAIDPVCKTKISNAASFAIAQEIGVAVQGADVVGYKYGSWTELVGSNTGADEVTVRIGNRINRGMTIKTYLVSAQQVGTSEDCNVTSVELVK